MLSKDFFDLTISLTLLWLGRVPYCVRSLPFNGYEGPFTVKWQWPNCSKVDFLFHISTLNPHFLSFKPRFRVLFREFPMTRLFTFCKEKWWEFYTDAIAWFSLFSHVKTRGYDFCVERYALGNRIRIDTFSLFCVKKHLNCMMECLIFLSLQKIKVM